MAALGARKMTPRPRNRIASCRLAVRAAGGLGSCQHQQQLVYKDAKYAGGIGTAFHSFVPATREGRWVQWEAEAGWVSRAVQVVHAMQSKTQEKQRLLPAGSGGSKLGRAGSHSAMSRAVMWWLFYFGSKQTQLFPILSSLQGFHSSCSEECPGSVGKS